MSDQRLQKLSGALATWWRHHVIAIAASAGFLFVVGAWLLWGLVGVEWFARLRHGSYGPLTAEELGQTGDLFGGISAFFAALAFLGVGIGAFYQHRTWRISERQQVQQSFEPLFFHLLELYRSIEGKAYVSLPNAWPEPKGRNRLLGLAIEDLRGAMAHHWGAIVKAPIEKRAQVTCTEYEALYELNEAQLGTYFRSIYHVFALIDRSRLDPPEKAQYASIARSILDTEVLFLLAINCLTPRGAGMKRLVTKYGLLKHVRKTDGSGHSMDIQIVEWFYAASTEQS